MKNYPVVIDDTQWAGNEQSLAQYLAMLRLDEERMQAGVVYQTVATPADQEELPYLLERQGNVGVIQIKGPTTNKTSWYDEYGKRATYPAIREALVAAAQHAEITKILLDIDSGGGAVSGVADTASLIREVSKVKPVTAFTDGSMFSAAYWLGASAGKVYMSKAAGAGSIGVIATHMDLSGMFKEMGITPTVVRAGKFKALANEMEPLSDKGREQIQAALDATYTVFVEHVAAMRGVDYAKADSTMAQGKEFYGDAAVSAGLIDGVSTYDKVFSKLSVDKQQGISHNPHNFPTGNAMKTALTEQQIAAIASGATAPAAAAPTPGAAADATPANPESTEKTPVVTEGQTAPAPAAATPTAGQTATPASPAPDATLVSYLQGQIKEKDAALVQSGISLKAATDKVADLEASTSGLIAIAVKSTNNMRVALSGTALDMSAMSAAQVLAEHDSVSKQFTTKFVAGGVAAVDAAQAKTVEKKDQEPDALTRARLQAANTQSRK
jgi:signal peptide peptidase SppA